MALHTVPGFIGYEAKRVSSMDRQAIGKFTDTNSLYRLRTDAPEKYPKKVLSLYTQSRMWSNDFLQMIMSSETVWLNAETFSYDVMVPYMLPVIVDVPASTLNQANIGIDGKEFEIVVDRQAFFIHNHITPDRRFGPQFYVISDGEPVHNGWKYRLTLDTLHPMTDSVDPFWLQPGMQLHQVGSTIGEFDQELPGLPEMGSKMTLYHTMSSAYGVTHKITKWAKALQQVDSKGNPLDLIVYRKYKVGETGEKVTLGYSWESLVEAEMTKEMLAQKVRRWIWSKPGSSRSYGTSQEVKKVPMGLYYMMRNHSNYHSYNKGEFSINLLRNIFGDLFHGREDVNSRKVLIFTNLAGMEEFNTAAKRDAMGTNLVFNVGDNDKFIQGTGLDLTMKFSFSKVWTLDTGEMSIVHLKELDEAETNLEYGQNKKRPPIFFVFDITPSSDGRPGTNIKELRLKGWPGMTSGTITGRAQWAGPLSGQRLISASMDPAARIWMEDRDDIFVEDLSRMVLIEERPQY